MAQFVFGLAFDVKQVLKLENIICMRSATQVTHKSAKQPIGHIWFMYCSVVASTHKQCVCGGGRGISFQLAVVIKPQHYANACAISFLLRYSLILAYAFLKRVGSNRE